MFATMFLKMGVKHKKRISGHLKDTRPVWYFFDLKSYIIMELMMSLGIWLRSSCMVSQTFVAVFYSGLGLALSLAGIFFTYMYFTYVNEEID
ncbi:MAG: hypothetical protein E7F50_05360 [Peptostreptococcus sp.]|jgi:hypothetical protein|uniref:Uncharacterized protein n=2 Tax=Peptostreptococcaceae TaxID=186804 RepID=A0A135YVD9_9FIRM|nr:hypothetical protein [uncultured Peptostreptococcus sp.]KXB69978.1 hypothetical protein HMPREF3183_01383 [Peptostreptococcus anaerobius]KXI13311.1 hypothetical protein HMPREF3195_00787 [Peptostreptococcus anaerobius]MDU3455303.1 hypothetical protein [Peptostreptococcus sp.]